MKIVQITDTHFVPPGQMLYGLDPAQALRRIVADIEARNDDADLVVITGDLANDGDEEAYRLLRETLAPLKAPIRLMLGNHDSRPVFRKVFPDMPVDGNGYVQSSMTTQDGALRLLFLDSHAAGIIGGTYCEERLDWLEGELAAAPQTPVIVFIHHPPFETGLAHFRHIGFHGPERLVRLLEAHRAGVRHLYCGHIHVSLSGTSAGGIAFTAARGASHQFIVDPSDPRPWWTAGAGPNYTVITVDGIGVRATAFDTLDAEPSTRAPECLGP